MKLRIAAVLWFALVVAYALDIRSGTPGIRETWVMLTDTERAVRQHLCDQAHTNSLDPLDETA